MTLAKVATVGRAFGFRKNSYIRYSTIFFKSKVTNVWIKHWWRASEMAWFRYQYCPSFNSYETYNTLCTVPVVPNETAWCLANYNETNCSDLQDTAQARTAKTLLTIYYFTAFGGIVLICLCLLSADTLERMISKPLVAKARTSSIPLLLLLPILWCVVVVGTSKAI